MILKRSIRFWVTRAGAMRKIGAMPRSDSPQRNSRGTKSRRSRRHVCHSWSVPGAS
jgi:hypothetical protein